MLSCNTILSSCLTTLIAQTSFYILTGDSEIGLQAAPAIAEILLVVAMHNFQIGVAYAPKSTHIQS